MMIDSFTEAGKSEIIELPITKTGNHNYSINDTVFNIISDDMDLVNSQNQGDFKATKFYNQSLPDFEMPSQLGTFADRAKKNYFNFSQRWVGNIIKLNNDENFTAKLEDLNDPTTYEIAEFNIRDVPADDKEFLKVGNSFYWSVGYEVKNGQNRKASVLKFQRLPKMDEHEIDRKINTIDNVVDRVDEIIKKINWE
jgi:hypothetical protein